MQPVVGLLNVGSEDLKGNDAVREAAARTQCLNNLKQWGLAMHAHHDALKHLPPGAVNSPRHTWVVHLWPYIEQQPLAALYGNINTQQFYTPNATIYQTTNGACAVEVALYYCPSDRGPAYWKGDGYYRARSNYAVCYGPNTVPWTPLASARIIQVKPHQSATQPPWM